MTIRGVVVCIPVDSTPEPSRYRDPEEGHSSQMSTGTFRPPSIASGALRSSVVPVETRGSVRLVTHSDGLEMGHTQSLRSPATPISTRGPPRDVGQKPERPVRSRTLPGALTTGRGPCRTQNRDPRRDVWVDWFPTDGEGFDRTDSHDGGRVEN